MNSRILIALFCTCCFLSTQAQKSKEYLFNDEFNYKGLPDSSKWNYDVGGHGWGNQELQYYTKARLANARVENGHLIIEAKKEDWEGMHYTSARLTTKGKGDWTYAKIKVRAKLPKGRGTWPAIWMLSSKQNMNWPDDGEIDIMEHVGFDPGQIHGTVHCKKYNHIIGTQKGAQISCKNFYNKFHDYEVEWKQDSIIIGMDGKYFFSFKNETKNSSSQAADNKGYDAWPFDNPMHLILNIAVGGGWGGQKGVDEKIWPQKMIIDYVRVYQR